MNLKTRFMIFMKNGPDKAFEDLGYDKVEETDHHVRYSKIEYGKYEHIIEICNHKNDGIRVQSYSSKDFCVDALGRPIGNCGVALTDCEMEIILYKIKEMKKKAYVALKKEN